MSEIDNYLAPLPSEQRAALAHVRAIIARAAPDAAEGQSYGMPAFRLPERPLPEGVLEEIVARRRDELEK